MIGRRPLADLTARLLWRSGILAASRRLLTARSRIALVFHGVSGRRRPAIARPVQPWHSADELRQTLTWLAARFNFLTPDEFFAAKRPGVLLTFDDGLANNVAHALPVLEAFNAPAIFFVATQHVDEPRNWLAPVRRLARQGWGSEAAVPEQLATEFFDGLSGEQVAACARHPLLTVAAHTVSHPLLTTCPDERLREELVASRCRLETLTGRPVRLFAYPAGDYDQRVVAAVRAAGYQAGFAVHGRGVGWPAFEIERIGLYRSHPAYLSARLCGVGHRAATDLELEVEM